MFPEGVRVLRARSALALFVAVTLAAPGCAPGAPRVVYATAAPAVPHASWTFDNDPAGGLPSGAEPYGGRWTVRPEPGSPSPPNALCQVGEAEFPAVALSSAVYREVTVSVRFKTISGRVDQAAGVIFRVQDKDNYYILRANALEANVNLYKYAGGRRTTMKEGNAKVASGEWQELRVEVAGDRMRGYLNGQPVAEVTDTTYRAGRIGLWTKADSVTCFDDVAVTPQDATRATDAPTAAAGGTVVQFAEHFYSPASLTVKVGTTVTWRSVGTQTHDVNAGDGSFRSGDIQPGNTFSYTFTVPGRYRYFCIPHAGDGMTGEIVVE